MTGTPRRELLVSDGFIKSCALRRRGGSFQGHRRPSAEREGAGDLVLRLAGSTLLVLLCQPRLPGIIDFISDARSGFDSVAVRPVYWAIVVGTVSVCLYTCLRKSETQKVNNPVLPWLIGSTVWVLLSVVWSSELAASARDAIAFSATVLVGVLIGMRSGSDQVLLIIRWASTALIAMSLLYIAVLPSISVATGSLGDRWRGAFPNENDLGRWAVFFAVCYLGNGLSKRGAVRLMNFGVCGLGVMIAWQTESTQARGTLLIIGPLLAGASWVLGNRALKFGASEFVVLASASMGVLVFVAKDWILGVFGESSDLNSRTFIWRFVWGKIEERPLLGTGVGAYWRGNAPDIDGVVQATGLRAFQAHNAYLDWFLGLGFVGVVLLTGVFIRLLYSLAARQGARPLNAYGICAALMLVLVVGSFSATLILAGRTEWLYVVCLMAGSLSRRRRCQGVEAAGGLPSRNRS